MFAYLAGTLAALSTLAAAAPAPAPAPTWSQPTAPRAETDASRFLAEIGRVYDTADGPTFVNDHPGRLRIYREVMARMEAATPAVRANPEWRRKHLFYDIAVAVTLADAGEQAAGEREVDRLLPQAQEFVSANPRDVDLIEGLGRLLRQKGQFAQTRGDVRAALPIFRAIVPVTEALVADDSFSDRDYGERSLAIDLDNLANMEALAGNRAEADRASGRALAIFRSLAARAPESRPAQGSLLIALLRRALNFREVERLDEAESQIIRMRARGQLIDRYAAIPAQIPAIRAEIAQPMPR